MTAPVPGLQLAEEFEQAFRNVMSLVSNADSFIQPSKEEQKFSMEEALENFRDMGIRMENFFLNKKLLAAEQNPDNFLAQGIQELTGELNRKEQIFQKYYTKLDKWKQIMRDDDIQIPSFPTEATCGSSRPTIVPMPPIPPEAVHPIHAMFDLNMPSRASQAPMPPTLGMQGPPMHQHMYPGTSQAIGLPGPLAYMERPMSNYTMPE